MKTHAKPIIKDPTDGSHHVTIHEIHNTVIPVFTSIRPRRVRWDVEEPIVVIQMSNVRLEMKKSTFVILKMNCGIHGAGNNLANGGNGNDNETGRVARRI